MVAPLVAAAGWAGARWVAGALATRFGSAVVANGARTATQALATAAPSIGTGLTGAASRIGSALLGTKTRALATAGTLDYATGGHATGAVLDAVGLGENDALRSTFRHVTDLSGGATGSLGQKLDDITGGLLDLDQTGLGGYAAMALAAYSSLDELAEGDYADVIRNGSLGIAAKEFFEGDTNNAIRALGYGYAAANIIEGGAFNIAQGLAIAATTYVVSKFFENTPDAPRTANPTFAPATLGQ